MDFKSGQDHRISVGALAGAARRHDSHGPAFEADRPDAFFRGTPCRPKGGGVKRRLFVRSVAGVET